mmetsp:Transcript_18829/g.33818  ORF Transcript_18829/g.33818 Transcript_18829/m.33818 type:complete len:1080 (-) Transcript_18829:79-3318(-)|eukprot:CAMPEP_0196135164 /NCGR_PEP_ID=MMETSP0910-20130528/3899_1 /TAXON_ID=49265 /ORGANISM="Thalassiosira rotula, Strain GSO102" /LENGTH=1079 /DNA_ID=CAMNT_0041395265 /DNA_START=77 /DNA_END=3316 /DNA_ORIENTATION=+
MSGMHLSREFFELIKAIGESKSKQEEDRIIAREVVTLKKKLETKGNDGKSSLGMIPGSPHLPGGAGGAKGNALNTNKKKAREFLVRCLYVEMLGHDGSFGYIKAVELAASQSIIHKRTGYLVCSCCLSPEHEFRFMLVNQMQRDLISSNLLESCGALLAVTSLITSDLVGTVSTQVIGLLEHSAETVRKKAIIALHRLHQLAPDVVTQQELIEKVRRMLCDRDPAVMGATLNVIEAIARVNSQPFKDLVPSLISILKQICERRLPSEYDYHRIPAPWMQMKIVRILSVIGKNDSASSEGMYEILGDCLRKAEEAGINASNAIVYECIRCITNIYPNNTLLDCAGASISRFLSSRSQNLRYLGVTGLASIVEKHPKYAADHQLAVIECLEDQDETLLRKTLDLLYRMTNPVNVEFITIKLLHFLRGSTDPFLRADLTTKICTIAERYAPNNAWYVRTITELFKIAGDLVDDGVATNLMSLIAEGTGNEEDDEEADMVLRKQAVELYVCLLGNPPNRMSRVLVETLAWVVGEYGYLSSAMPLDAIIDGMCALLSGSTARLGGGVQSTRRLILSAIMKMVSQYGSCPTAAAKCIDDYTKSSDPDAQKRCLEFQTILTQAPQLLGEVFPVDASLEDVEVDINMSFLDGVVGEAISTGAQPYQKPDDDDDDDDDFAVASQTASAFKMTPYEKPTEKTYGQGMMQGLGSSNMGVAGAPNVTLPPGSSAGAVGPQGAAAPEQQPTNPAEPQLVLRNVANVWGKQAPTVQPPAATVPSTSSFASATTSSASSGYGGFGASPVAAAPVAPVKTEEQLEKERMAAALFGGISGAPPPPPPSTPAQPAAMASPQMTPAASIPQPTPAPPAVVSPQFTPAVAAAPEVDLLGFDMDTTTTMAAGPTMDMLAPTPLVQEPEPVPTPAAAPPAPAPAAPAVPADPFAAAGLLDGFADPAPLPSFSTTQALDSAKFEFGGAPIAPLTITTPQFGERWGQCPHAQSANIPSSTSSSTLAKFMALCERAGLHKVEEIAATNEGIAACMAGGGSSVALIHGKISPLPGGTSSGVDVTVKSTDPQLSLSLSMYLQNMIR